VLSAESQEADEVLRIERLVTAEGELPPGVANVPARVHVAKEWVYPEDGTRRGRGRRHEAGLRFAGPTSSTCRCGSC
jgi:hypothetical protein